jgi:hypothetical protein
MIRSCKPSLTLLAMLFALALPSSSLAEPTVQLATAGSFALLAGTPSISNTGLTGVVGDVGIDPAVSVIGFGGPPNGTIIGTLHAGDLVAGTAKDDLTLAYDDASGRAGSVLASDELDGAVLPSGVYSGGALNLAVGGTITLDGQNDPNAVFIIRAASSLVAESGSNVLLTRGAQSCNVFWVVASSATVGTNASFVGNVLALTSISALTGATVNGRLLARNGEITLDTNQIVRSTCAAVTPPGGDGGGTPPGGGGGGVIPPGGGTPPVGSNPDVTRPTIIVRHLPRTCVERSFVLRVVVRDSSSLRRARLYVDGRLVARLHKGVNLVTIRARGLRAGMHRVRVVATDRAGNTRVIVRRFARCHAAVAVPHFTG